MEDAVGLIFVVVVVVVFLGVDTMVFLFFLYIFRTEIVCITIYKRTQMEENEYKYRVCALLHVRHYRDFLLYSHHWY